MAGGTVQPNSGGLIAIEIELRIGSSSESGIAHIGGDANHGVGIRITIAQRDSPADRTFIGKHLAGERLTEHHCGRVASAYVGSVKSSAFEHAHGTCGNSRKRRRATAPCLRRPARREAAREGEGRRKAWSGLVRREGWSRGRPGS